MVIGYAPALAYRLLEVPSDYKRLALRGSGADIVRRFDIFVAKHHSLWNLPSEPTWRQVLVAFVAMACAVFLLRAAAALSRWFRSGERASRALAMAPLFFFPLVIMPLFVLSNAVVDLESGRYLYPLQLFYAAAIGYAFSELWQLASGRWRLLSGSAALILTFALAVNGTQSFQRYYAAARTAPRLQRLISALDRHQISVGYGDFWYSYIVTHLTNERIIIEPLYSQHIAQYRGFVRRSGHPGPIAYIVSGQTKYQPQGGVVSVGGLTYEVIGSEQIEANCFLYIIKPLNAVPGQPS
jgi:hypothetical protein